MAKKKSKKSVAELAHSEMSDAELEEFLSSAIAEIARRETEEPIGLYSPLSHQLDFHKSKARIRWVLGGNRSGKTVAGAVEIVWRALGKHPSYKKKPGKHVFWVVARTNDVQREVTQKEVLKWLPKDEIKGNPRFRQRGIVDYIDLKNGNRIVFKTCEQGRDTFKGAEVAGIWLDEEPNPHGEYIFDECVARIASCGGFLWGTMTPDEGVSWTYERVFKSPKSFVFGETNPDLIKEKEYHVFKFLTEDNFHNDPEVINIIRSGITDELQLRTRLYGEYTYQAGLIFKEWNPDMSLIKQDDVKKGKVKMKLSKHFDYYMGIDTGRCFATLFAAIDHYGNTIVFDEYYSEDGIITDHASVLWSIIKDSNIPTPVSFVDPSSQFKKELWDCNICAYNANNDVLDGIDLVRKAMKVHPGKPRGRVAKNPMLYISDKCERLIWEIERYMWDEWKGDARLNKNPKSQPRKKDDHMVDCLRYILASRSDPAENPHYIPDPMESPEEAFHKKILNRTRKREAEKTGGFW